MFGSEINEVEDQQGQVYRGFLDLPDDVKHLVFDYFRTDELINTVSTVNRKFRELIFPYYLWDRHDSLALNWQLNELSRLIQPMASKNEFDSLYAHPLNIVEKAALWDSCVFSLVLGCKFKNGYPVRASEIQQLMLLFSYPMNPPEINYYALLGAAPLLGSRGVDRLLRGYLANQLNTSPESIVLPRDFPKLKLLDSVIKQNIAGMIGYMGQYTNLRQYDALIGQTRNIHRAHLINLRQNSIAGALKIAQLHAQIFNARGTTIDALGRLSSYISDTRRAELTQVLLEQLFDSLDNREAQNALARTIVKTINNINDDRTRQGAMKALALKVTDSHLVKYAATTHLVRLSFLVPVLPADKQQTIVNTIIGNTEMAMYSMEHDEFSSALIQWAPRLNHTQLQGLVTALKQRLDDAPKSASACLAILSPQLDESDKAELVQRLCGLIGSENMPSASILHKSMRTMIPAISLAQTQQLIRDAERALSNLDPTTLSGQSRQADLCYLLGEIGTYVNRYERQRIAAILQSYLDNTTQARNSIDLLNEPFTYKQWQERKADISANLHITQERANEALLSWLQNDRCSTAMLQTYAECIAQGITPQQSTRRQLLIQIKRYLMAYADVNNKRREPELHLNDYLPKFGSEENQCLFNELQSVLQEDPNAKSLKTSELTPLVKHLSPDLTSEQRQTLVDDIAYDCTLAQDFCHQLQSFEAHAMEDTPNQHVVQPANFETLKRFYQRLQDHCRDLYRDGLDQDRLTRITERLEPLINRRMACFQIQNSLDKLTDEIERQRPYLNQYPGIKQVLKELVYTIATAGIYAGYKLGVVVSNRYHYGHYTFFAAQARSLNTLDELRQDLKNT